MGFGRIIKTEGWGHKIANSMENGWKWLNRKYHDISFNYLICWRQTWVAKKTSVGQVEPGITCPCPQGNDRQHSAILHNNGSFKTVRQRVYRD
jgi:hypothetical protein